MIVRAHLLWAALLLAAAGGQSPGDAFFDTRTASGYGDPVPALSTYLSRARPRPAGPQRFCVVGYAHADGDRTALVHWREGRRLILWDGRDPDHPASLLTWGRRDLDLTRDVVATEAAIAGSTYLVTRAWADRVVADCARHGARYTVAAGSRRRR